MIRKDQIIMIKIFILPQTKIENYFRTKEFENEKKKENLLKNKL